MEQAPFPVQADACPVFLAVSIADHEIVEPFLQTDQSVVPHPLVRVGHQQSQPQGGAFRREGAFLPGPVYMKEY